MLKCFVLIYELLTSRRTIHLYKPELLLKEDVLKAIEVGTHAPNHKNTQPWRFTLVGQEARKKIADVAIELKSETTSLSHEAKSSLRDKFIVPSHLIVVSQVKNPDPFRSKEDYGAIACAIQNMSLFLWPKNIGTKWSTGKVTRYEKTYKILSIDSNKEEIVGFFWLGRPMKIPKKPQKCQIKDILREVD